MIVNTNKRTKTGTLPNFFKAVTGEKADNINIWWMNIGRFWNLKGKAFLNFCKTLDVCHRSLLGKPPKPLLKLLLSIAPPCGVVDTRITSMSRFLNYKQFAEKALYGVIPAKAGIHNLIDFTNIGFPIKTSGMTEKEFFNNLS